MSDLDNPASNAQRPARKWDAVRVFVSSTFRDMHAERDELVKNVFPALRKQCRARGIEFVEVDLRWGVTEEQAERGEVLPICLAEIERCRPYFIGLLGERYGSASDALDETLLAEEPWLVEQREQSITELEILHGVLNDPEMAPHSFFYFRAPGYIESIPEEKRADFEPESAEAKTKLAALKGRIRRSGLSLSEGYTDPAAVGKLIFEDLSRVINEEYPEGSEPDPLDREAADHDAFAESRARIYIGRREYFERLNQHAAGSGPPLVVLGESGSGKSALLANWLRGYRVEHPDDFVLEHYIGGTADSIDYGRLLRRILAEIKRRCEVQDEVPTDDDAMREALPQWLAYASAKGPFVLVLDALNQLEDRDHALDLAWLPRYWPPNIRLIVSTLPGRTLSALQSREWPALAVEPLLPEEREKLVVEYLRQYRKELSSARVRRIIEAPPTAQPLYLRTLLNELRVFGRYEELDARIDDYLGATDSPTLFGKVLARLEEDYERDCAGLVGQLMSLLWAARRGLSETELRQLLGSRGTPFPQAVLSPLLLAAEDHLVDRSGLLNFFHDFLRQAVRQRYLADESEQREAHLCLAEFFEQNDVDDRKIDELPWQLERAQEWEQLKECIANLEVFGRLQGDARKYELLEYWLAIGSRHDMAEAYHESLAQSERTGLSGQALVLALNRVAVFLMTAGRFERVEPLNRRALAISEQALGAGHPETARSLNILARLLHAKGDYEAEEPLYRRALTIFERVLGSDCSDTAAVLDNLAELLHTKGDYAGAEPLYRRALGIWERTLGVDHPDTATSLNNLAGLLFSKGDYEGAEVLYRRALAICEQALGANHPDTAGRLLGLAEVLRTKGNYDGAEPLYRRALAICEQALGADHPTTATSLNNLATLRKDKGDYDGAELLYRRVVAIRDQALGANHLDTAWSLSNLAGLLREKGDYDGAESLYRRALVISKQALGADNPHIAGFLNNLAALLWAKGDYDGAEPLHRRSLAIREQALGTHHPNTALSLDNLAGLLLAKGDYEGAEPLFRRALAIREQVLSANHPDTATSLNNLALLLYSKGDYDEAEPLYRRALAIREQALGADHPDTAGSLSNLAGLLKATGDYDGAEPFYRRALAIREQALGADHPDTATSLNNLAGLLYAKGDYDGAEPLYRRALAICEQALGADHPDTAGSLSNLAGLLCSMGDYEGAEPIFRRLLAIREQVLSANHPDTATSLNNLAWLLYSKGDYDEAEPLYRRALAIREQALGADHPDTATSLHTLALLREAKGDYQVAEPLYRRALAIREQALGVDHPNTDASLNSLAGLLCAKGDYEGAEPLFRRILAVHEAAQSPDNQQIASALNNLSSCLVELCKYAEAEPLLVRATELRDNYPNAHYWLAQLFQRRSASGDAGREAAAWRRYLAIGATSEQRRQEAEARLVDLES